jgi:hypothetical protein
MFFGGASNSLANPTSGSSSSTLGTKPVGSFMVMSVGDKSTGTGYLTLDKAGNKPVVSTKSGVIEFSIPQDHSYVGIGDVVSIQGNINVYLVEKISTKKWKCKLADGKVPPNKSNATVDSINKVFSSLSEAISGLDSGFKQIIGSSNLVQKGFGIVVANYKKAEPEIVVSTIHINGWTTNKSNPIKIISPWNVKTQCNSSQYHDGFINNGFIVDGSSHSDSIIRVSNDNVIIDGLNIKSGSSSVGQSCIKPDSGISGLNISHNILVGGEYGVFGSTTINDMVVSCNIITGTTQGALKVTTGSTNNRIYNNTIVNCNRGITSEVSGSVIKNNLIALCSTYCYSGSNNSIVINNFASDGTLPPNENTNNYSPYFVDYIDKDYHIDCRDYQAAVGGLKIELIDDEDYPKSDINRCLIDNTFSVGAHHYTPILFLSVGTDGQDADIKSGEMSFSITNSILTFTNINIGDKVSSGCLVHGADGSKYYLYGMVGSGTWKVTDHTGNGRVADKTSTGVSKISYVFHDLYNAFYDAEDGSGKPGVENVIGESDLIHKDIKLVISCVDGISSRKLSFNHSIKTDITRDITVYTPKDVDLDCVTSRRHNGVADDLYFRITDGVEINTGYVTIDGLQISASECGIKVTDCKRFVIKNNITHDCGFGILVDSKSDDKTNVFVNNIIYDCVDSGLDIKHNFGEFASCTIGVNGSNSWKLRSLSRSIKTNNYMISVIHGIYNEITWKRRELIITTPGGKLSEILNNATVVGRPWAEISIVDDVDNLQYFESREFKSFDLFVPGNSGKCNSRYAIYNNTINNCKNGINIEVKPGYNFTNIVTLKNNVVGNCKLNDYISSGYDERFVSADSCWSSDKSAAKFKGQNNRINTTPTYRNFEYKDFRITLSDSVSMDRACILSSDGQFSFNFDCKGVERSSIKWDIGADNFSFPSKTPINLSVGSNVGNLDINPIGRTASIHKSILKFKGESIGDYIGVGDVVSFGPDGGPYNKCYLIEKGDSNTWLVGDHLSNQLEVEYENQSVESVKRFSNSLNESMSNGGSINNLLLSRNLTSLGKSLFVWTYGDLDSMPVTISDWVTSYDNFIKILTPWNAKTQCNKRQRHGGKWGSGYGLLVTTGNCININNNNVSIEGLRLSSNPAGALLGYNGVVVGDGYEGVSISYNIIKDVDNGIIQVGDSKAMNVVSNTIYDVSDCGVDIKNGNTYNTTVVGSGSVGFFAGDILNYSGDNVKFVNCIGQDCIHAFDIKGLRISCLSDDTSAGVENNCISSCILKFKNKPDKDFHLDRSDFFAINHGENLMVDSAYPFNFDIDMDHIDSNSWCIGSDSILNMGTINIALSSSMNQSDIKKGVLVKVNIVSGVATFSEDQDNENMGIGDCVNYGPINSKCYLVKKISEYQWEVCDKFGFNPENVLESTVNSIKHTFVDLKDVFGVSSNSIKEFYSNGGNLFEDLVKAKINISIPVYKHSSPHNGVVVKDFITSKDNTIRVYSPNIPSECNSNQRHEGVVNGNALTLVISNNHSFSFDILSDNITVDGLIINPNRSSSGSGGLRFNGCKNSKSIGCIIYGAVDGISNVNNDPASRNFCINNIIYSCLGDGIITSGNDVVLNNTLDLIGGFGIRNSVGDILLNNLVQDSVGSNYFNNTNIDYCVSKDGSAGFLKNNSSHAVVGFKNKASGDYNIVITDHLVRGKAKNLNNSGFCDYNNDGSGFERSRFWDIGALEYRTLYKAVYGIGAYYNNLRTDNGYGSLPYSIKIVGTRSLIEFQVEQSDYNFGVGCEILDINTPFTSGCLISEKVDKSRWFVTNYLGRPITPRLSGNADVIQYPFFSGESALDNSYGVFSQFYIGSKNLVNEEMCLGLAFYNNSLNANYDSRSNTSSVDVYNVTSDVDHYVRIFAPRDINKESNVSHSHGGFDYNGFVVGGKPGVGNFGIRCYNSNFVEIEGVVIRNTGSQGAIGIEINNSQNCLIMNNIVCKMRGNGISIINGGGNSKDTVINNLIHNCLGDGLVIGYPHWVSNTKSYVYNNTISDCRRGIYFVKSVGYDVSGSNSINNIAQNSRYRDFVSDDPEYYDIVNVSNSISMDETSSEFSGDFNIPNSRVEFYNKINGDYNLNDNIDLFAIGSAMDLTHNDILPFTIDISDQDRGVDGWDIGAFESSYMPLTVELPISSLEINSQAFVSNIKSTIVLYLRKTKIPTINEHIQFKTIEGEDQESLNKYFLSHNIPGNILIYVEGGESFTGQFKFGSMSGFSVTISTLSEELHLGPGILIYSESLISTNSSISGLKLDSIKVFSDDNYNQNYLFDSECGVPSLKLINSIVQVNRDAILDHFDCFVSSINSIVVYRNNLNSDIIYFVKNNSINNIIANSIILCFREVSINFRIGLTQNFDTINNSLFYNYGGLISLDIPVSRVVKSITNTNPDFEQFIIDIANFEVSTSMKLSLNPKKSSPCINTGDSSFVDCIEMDIAGNSRIFHSGPVDIGPYEVEVYQIVFNSGEVKSISQNQLVIDYRNKSCYSFDKNKVYKDLFYDFSDNNSYLREFVRESKIIFELKGGYRSYTPVDDKYNDLIISIEARYDKSTKSIISTKPTSLMGGALSEIFNDDRYTFYFDEFNHTLSVYLNKTYNKGLSGSANILKNVKFGGSPIIIR